MSKDNTDPQWHVWCPKHPKFQAVKRPVKCKVCKDIYDMARHWGGGNDLLVGKTKPFPHPAP